MKFASALFAATLLAGASTAANAGTDDASELLVKASYSSSSSSHYDSNVIMGRDSDRDHDSDRGHDRRESNDDDNGHENGYDDDDHRGRGGKRRSHDSDDR